MNAVRLTVRPVGVTVHGLTAPGALAERPAAGILFAILGSGSKGNSVYIEQAGAGFLLDLGLGPRVTAWRLQAIGRSWANVRAAIVSHCHGDHVRGATLAHLGRHRSRLSLHREHHATLGGLSGCKGIEREGRLDLYEGGSFEVVPGVTVLPVEVPHDVPTQAFVIDLGAAGGATVRIGYASDLGHVDGRLVEALADCDLIALEFNHDVRMELASGRDPLVIERVLGPHGHLSNEQAAEALERILRASRRRVPRHVVLLHLSEDCNEERLATRAALAVLGRMGVAGKVGLHVARQHEPGPILAL